MGPYVLLEFAYGTVGPSILSLRFLILKSESEKFAIVIHFSNFSSGTVLLMFGTVYLEWDRHGTVCFA